MIDDNDAVISSAVAGLGIASSGRPGFRGELDSGALVQVLPQWQMGSADIHVILPGGRAAKPPARAFAQFMATAFEDVLQNTR
ncbi:DNA-binding transcriptional LysR family regulator [Paraburkholderia sp. GAS333]|uniref:LysR substrate-binding domain-containing protein n=1 Tax=Paraburkholderia sp. GAS333 TaxID=3156279 RepID=UPI003D258FCC